MEKNRTDINFLKSFAIIIIILFHAGLLKNGYLGVDIFLVVAGFLTTKSILKNVKNNDFSYKKFFTNKLIRLLPVLLIATAVTFFIAYFIGMLPDNFENLAESIVASNFFSNNILAILTTKNYWDVWNDYKPLYHLWYLGILFEFYLIWPLLIMLIKKITKRDNFDLNLKQIFWTITVVSLMLFLINFIDDSYKFYLLPFRIFEFSSGALAFLYSNNINNLKYNNKNIYIYILLLIIIILFSPFNNCINLILTVLITSFILMQTAKITLLRNVTNFISPKTYSFFIWHQIVFAFYRCYISDIHNLKSIAICFSLIIIISLLSYYLIEIRIKNNKKTIITLIILDILITTLALLTYFNAGVVRDVPELDITKANAKRGMHAAYCDRIYKYTDKFPNKAEENKFNVLIIGNSFARDFANILLESKYNEMINIQYHFDYSDVEKNEVLKSDYIFIYGSKQDIPNIINNGVNDYKIWGIGTKNFGESNERFYRNRNSKDYFLQTVKPTMDIIDTNNKYKNEYKDRYINILELLQKDDGSINVFTDDGKYISQDCRHLTKNGAVYLANIIDLDDIFNKNS